MNRLLQAFSNSMRALRHLAVHETAVQQELVLLVLSLPAGWFLSRSWPGYALLVAVVLLLLIVEVLNTAIEAACNAVSRDFSADIRLAKDCGSLAVLIAVIVAVGTWGLALADWAGVLPT